MGNKEITICLTSCGRWDLLEKTIKSLVQFWDGPKPKELLIYEDQYLSVEQFNILFGFVSKCLAETKWTFAIYYGKVGQIKAIDFLYSEVETPYIFHCEDDWEFYRTGFIHASFEALEKHPKCINFWLREPDDTNGHPHKDRILSRNYNGMWGGFTFNPTLKRLADYKKIIKYSSHATFNPSRPWESESKISMLYRRMGYFAMIGEQGFVRHTGGNGRHISA